MAILWALISINHLPVYEVDTLLKELNPSHIDEILLHHLGKTSEIIIFLLETLARITSSHQINDCPNKRFRPYSNSIGFYNYPSTSDCKIYITDHRIKCPNSYWDDPDCKHDFFKTSCD